MTHGGFLYAAVLYNNGGFPSKNGYFGESYAPDGSARQLFEMHSESLSGGDAVEGDYPVPDAVAAV